MPGVDEVIRKVLAMLGGERGIRLLFQGNAVRVGPTQFPRLWHLHTEVATTFDWPDVPELYVSQTPFFNAGAYGHRHPVHRRPLGRASSCSTTTSSGCSWPTSWGT